MYFQNVPHNRTKIWPVSVRLLVLITDILLWATSHTRLRARDLTLQALSLVEKAEPVQLRFTLCLRDQRSMWMQDGCKVYVDSYMALNGSCFLVTWTTFKNHFLEIGLTQNQDTMALRTFTTVSWFYVIMCEDPAWIKIHWNSIWLRARSHMTSHHTWGFVTMLYDFGGALGRPLGTFFWALTISWSQFLARVWSDPQCQCQGDVWA